MFHKITNPFAMSNDALLEYSMNPDRNEIQYDSALNKYEVLGNSYEAYDPYKELVERAIEGNKGASVPDFLTGLDFKKPQFQEQDPDAVLIALNVKEQRDEFRRQQESKDAINAIFNPITGNTPEERAQNSKIKTLLAEIDNFAVQYKLSERQKEILKTQVLGNHLGDYIKSVNTIRNSDRQREQEDAMSLARGEGGQGGAPIPRDPVNGMDENGIRTDAGGSDTTIPRGGGGTGSATGGGGSAVGGGGTGSATGGVGDSVSQSGDPNLATIPIDDQEITEQGRRLAQILNDPPQSIQDRFTGNTLTFARQAVKQYRSATWEDAFDYYNGDTETRGERWYKDRHFDQVMPLLKAIFGFGEDIGGSEGFTLISIFQEAKGRVSLDR